MLNRSSIIFPIALAGLMALFTFWISQKVEEKAPKADGSNRHDPDYIMDNFVTTQTDEAGQLRYVLAAAKMLHYPDDDTTELEQPAFTQFSTDKPYTKIEGQRANVSPDGEEIEILEDVIVIREAFGGKGEMQLLTDQLTVFPNQDLAKTDRPVVITQAPKTVIKATGMVYDKKKKTMKLLSRVNAHYERPKGK